MPRRFGLIDGARASYAMVQVPVLPLTTPVQELRMAFTAMSSLNIRRLICLRGKSGRLLHSFEWRWDGFGTKILDELARERGNQVFDPASLTEGCWNEHSRA